MTIGTEGSALWLERALHAARAAGELLLDGRAAPGQDHLHPTTKSTATDVVTAMDRAAEQLIIDLLLEGRPHDGVVAEEGTGDRQGAQEPGGVTWIVDPLDGTVNYLYDLPHWAVSIAAEVEGAVVAGVVHVPRTEETFVATLGGGARLLSPKGDRDLGPVASPPLGQVLLATGFGYDARRRAYQGAVMAEVLAQVRDIRRLGAASIDLCHVAAGRVDAYVERGLQPWDLAAGCLIAAEAGATVAGPQGQAPDERLVMVAGPQTFDGLRRVWDRADRAAQNRLGPDPTE